MRTDALVIGGGPSGAAAAIALRQLGRTVAVVERGPVGAKPGEALPGAARAELCGLGLWDGFLAQAHHSVWAIKSAWGSDELATQDLSFHPYGQNWHLDRVAFDRLCLERTVQSGALLVRGKILQVAQHREGWLVDLDAGADARLIAARFIVDASGRAAAFARKHGGRRVKKDRLVGIAATFADIPRVQEPTFTLIEAAAQGWWYAARLPGNLMTAVYMTDADLLPSGHARRAALWTRELARTKHIKYYARPTQPATLRCWPSESVSLTRLYGQGWVAVGDAAMSFDPLSSQGICNALESGRCAALALDAALKNDFSALDAYQSIMNARFREFDYLREAYYAAEARWSGNEFWRRRSGRVRDRNRPVRDHGSSASPTSLQWTDR